MNVQQERLIFRLKEGELTLNRFLKVGDGKLHITHKHPEGEYLDKAAFETDFEQHLYSPEDLDSYPRWGICGCDFLVLLDFDTQAIYDIMKKRFPDTFEVTSPRHGLPHRYYIVCGAQIENNKFHIPGDLDSKGHKKPCGEIRANNHYLVAPGTTLRYEDLTTGKWTTGEYKITNDRPITRLEHDEFMAAVAPYLRDKIGERILTDDKLENGVNVGERHDTIFRYACRLVGDNHEGRFPASVALDMLRRYNQTKLADPVEDEFLQRVILEGCEYAAKETNTPVKQIIELGFSGIRQQQQDGNSQTQTQQEPIIPASIKQVPTDQADSLLEQGYKVKKIYDGNVVLEKQAVEAKDDTPKESQADRLIKYCLAQNPDLFFDQHNTQYVRVKLPYNPLTTCATCGINGISTSLGDSLSVDPKDKTSGGEKRDSPRVTETPKVPQVPQVPLYRNVIMQISDQDFKRWLAYLMYKAEEKAPGGDSLNSAVLVLGGKAQQEGQQYLLSNRVALDKDGSIWIDMCDDKWRSIKVTAKGWEIVNEPPIKFKRYPHQQAIAEPLAPSKGDAWKLMEYVNIKESATYSRLAFLCTAISYWIPEIAHPAIVASGAQGAAKSWAFILVRRINDPSSIELLNLPRGEEELAQHLEQHWLTPYDNLTYLPGWASDMLCRAITGGGIAKRKLYTDNESIILTFKRCVLLNGINIAAQKGDLLDRSMIFHFEPIDMDKRKTEADLTKEFNDVRSIIVTGFLNVLSQALKFFPEIKLKFKELQRLSDFNLYGCAIAKALGKEPEEFNTAYEMKVSAQNEEILNNDTVAQAIIKFAEKEVKGNGMMQADGTMGTDYWIGTPTDLKNKLSAYAQYAGTDTNSRTWPKNASALTRKINLVITALKSIGIKIESYDGYPRRISIDAKGLPTKEPKKRYCSEECKNYRTADCTAPDTTFDERIKRSDRAEIPKEPCKGYEQGAPGED